jgi:hypothetical protein
MWVVVEGYVLEELGQFGPCADVYELVIDVLVHPAADR